MKERTEVRNVRMVGWRKKARWVAVQVWILPRRAAHAPAGNHGWHLASHAARRMVRDVQADDYGLTAT